MGWESEGLQIFLSFFLCTDFIPGTPNILVSDSNKVGRVHLIKVSWRVHRSNAKYSLVSGHSFLFLSTWQRDSGHMTMPKWTLIASRGFNGLQCPQWILKSWAILLATTYHHFTNIKQQLFSMQIIRVSWYLSVREVKFSGSDWHTLLPFRYSSLCQSTMVKVKTWYSLLMYAQFGQKTKELGPFEIVVLTRAKKDRRRPSFWIW
jgi:hypothetical protein